ncbi:MAG: hypothetical protein DWQ36_14275 [Acidobacteria bacterium]|nr:MAG: hypothetical protein DWQ30_19675 [Acidobacteriota bacterium]REK06371.1 MAG: hypothetical protein DWQ36_14275 [Acidobacteriota bacterium]
MVQPTLELEAGTTLEAEAQGELVLDRILEAAGLQQPDRQGAGGEPGSQAVAPSARSALTQRRTS